MPRLSPIKSWDLFFSSFSDLNKCHGFKYNLSANNSHIYISGWIPSLTSGFLCSFSYVTPYSTPHLGIWWAHQHYTFKSDFFTFSMFFPNLFFPKSLPSQCQHLTSSCSVQKPWYNPCSLTIHSPPNSKQLSVFKISSESDHSTPLLPWSKLWCLTGVGRASLQLWPSPSPYTVHIDIIFCPSQAE